MEIEPNAYVSGSSGFNLSSGATIAIGSTAGITASTSTATGNIRCTNTRFFSTGANYEYNGTASQVTGTGLPTSGITGNVIITNTAGVTPTSAFIVNTAGNLIV